MTQSQIPTNSFYSYGEVQLYKNASNVMFITMENNPVKQGKFPIEVEVDKSSKENFVNTLKKASTKDAMSHLLQEGLLKELT